MIFNETTIRLKDGRTAILRSPQEEDAKDMLRFIIKACGETDFLLKYPEDFDGFTAEQEKAFIQGIRADDNTLMIACFVDGAFAGNCQISFCAGMKDRHRASIAIALLREFWNLGIGNRMLEEMIRTAKEREGVRQIELDFIEGNSRARALYEKAGFRITGVQPDAIRLKDGTFVNQYLMMKKL